jgi:adenine/guanine phosphoribosyltransferase-like PRPP-binding protein
VIDDFLANGQAALGLIDLIHQAKLKLLVLVL